ncbi:MAG TPA: hypothetical protein VGO36_05305 [Solirubrobacterales bacterium]|nr:hypothetical protein [Solirubrobacterales bacterium]
MSEGRRKSSIVESGRARAVALRDRYWRGNVPVWASGLLVALLTWQTSFIVPAPGLDLSWMGGLYMAVRDGKQFGDEIVFTYGPLGFLVWPGLWFSWLGAIAFAFSATIYILFAVAFVGSLRRGFGLAAAGLIAFLYLVTVPDAEQLPLVLAVALCFLALREERSARAVTLLAAGGGLLSAIEILVKLSVGPMILVVCLLGMVGARAERRQWALFAASSLGGLIVLWLVTGQALGNLWDYAVNGAQVASGYNEAMGIGGAERWEGVVLILAAVGIVVAAACARFRDARARVCAALLTAAAAFASFKYGIVRFEPYHLSLGLSAMLGIWFLMPWPRRRAAALLVAGAVIGAVAIHTYPTEPRLDVVANLKTARDAAELLVRPGLRQGRVNEARANLRTAYALDPAILAALGNRRVSIDPWEIGAAWAYDLNWSPLPVFQNYTAYTHDLDRLNAAAVEDPDGPQAILRANPGGVLPLGGARSIEGRLPAWDPPEQNFATVCNFAPAASSPTWQVLLRRRERCGPERPISQLSAAAGEDVAVPRARRGELVLLRLHGVEVEGLERVSSTLWRPRVRTAVLDDGLVTYRLVPGTSGDGLVVARDPRLDGVGPFVQLPNIKTMRIEGVAGPFEFDFYRVRVRPLPHR